MQAKETAKKSLPWVLFLLFFLKILLQKNKYTGVLGFK